MTPEQTATLRASAIAAGQAAAQAGTHAVLTAVTEAAENASKPGGTSSEFKVTLGTVGSILVVTLLSGLHVFTLIPGPWMIPALILSGAISAGSYALSRGNVKSAALAAAGAAVSTAAGAVAQGYVLKPATLGTRVAPLDTSAADLGG